MELAARLGFMVYFRAFFRQKKWVFCVIFKVFNFFHPYAADIFSNEIKSPLSRLGRGVLL
jgi:hypothetical protein